MKDLRTKMSAIITEISRISSLKPGTNVMVRSLFTTLGCKWIAFISLFFFVCSFGLIYRFKDVFSV